ncbi:phage major capsid protein [Natronorarus salvus]|uniref:phage major capsid protein n=1 Tax=Natronorarus salvus TaxID=3117733 RepID=UPI002F260EAE
MPTTTQNVPVQSYTIESILEERTAPMYQFRNAFRDYDATDNDEEEIKFPTPSDDFLRDTMADIDELSQYPQMELEYGEASATWAKYGFAVTISDEAVRFSRIDAELDAQGQMMESNARKLDAQAYELLAEENNDIEIGDGETDFNYEVTVDAWVEMMDQEYNPDRMLWVVGPQAFGELAKDDRFTHATDRGDELIRNRVLEDMFGTPYVLSNTGDLTDDAFLVDTGTYGYEVEWEPTSVEVVDKRDIDGTMYKISGMWGYGVTDPQAAMYVPGGVA